MTMHLATTFGSRLRGWMGRRWLDPDEALWLVPCRAVHTLGMRMPIDVVFLDDSDVVLRVVAALPPWRACADRHARSVLELPAGGAAARGLRPGVRIAMAEVLPVGREPLSAGGSRPPGILLAAAAFLALAFPLAQVRAAAPLIDEPAVPDVPPVAIVFQTEWTPDPRRLVEEAMLPEPDRMPARTGASRWWLGGAGPNSLPTRTVAAAPAPAAGAPAPVIAAVAAPVHFPAAPPAFAAQVPSGPAAAGGTSLAVAGCPASSLPPMALQRPLAPDTLARAVEEADGLYHAKQWLRALEAFCGLAEIDPGNRLAWLRIGNLQHQRSRLPHAAEAYRQAARMADAGDTTEPSPVRARALANLMAVALEIARDSIGELRQLNLSPQASAMQLVEQVGAELRALVPESARPVAAAPARPSLEISGARTGRLVEPVR
jgi:uncharacterized membrane protein (UPF0127 family)